MDEIKKGIEGLNIPTKRKEVKDLEKQIRSLQVFLAKVPVERENGRKLIKEKINRKKILLDRMMNKMIPLPMKKIQEQ